MSGRETYRERDPLLGGGGDRVDYVGPRGATSWIAAAVAGIFLLVLFETSFTVIKPGEVGVVVTLGHITTFPPGPHFRAPFISRVTRMSTKTQLVEQANTIPTKEGLSVKLDTAILYHLDAGEGGSIFRGVGVNYREVLIEPEAASAIRGLTSESDAKALYTSGRNVMQEALKEELAASLGPRGIVIEDVLLKDVELPDELSKSIELKAKAEQDAFRMQFVLQKEKQEADRKAIEAEGIANFQKIVSQGISPQYLKWKGIEATEKLVESRNAKLVIMGNSQNGLPVLLSANEGGTADYDI